MKNKNKSKKIAKELASAKKNVTAQDKEYQKKQAELKARNAAKENKKKEAQALLNSLRGMIQQPEVPPGVDPKTITCAYFKLGVPCPSGDKCKFAHALAAKKQKIDIYTDPRDTPEERFAKTDIICKYFLQALEEEKYGFFWDCPNNGKNCQYRHAVPVGYVLKKDRLKEEEEDVFTDNYELELELEAKRAQLTSLTPSNFEFYTKLLNEKLSKESEALDKKNPKKKGKTGLQLFVESKDSFVDDTEAIAADLKQLKIESDEEARVAFEAEKAAVESQGESCE